METTTNTPTEADRASSACSALPKYTGKYFAIWNGEPVILTVEETYATITYAEGETDPLYYHDDHGVESWVAVEKAFGQNAEGMASPEETPESN